MRVLLEAIVGSTAHGLATESSDIDMAGVFLRPTIEFSLLGYHQKDDSVHSVTPEKDITYHEVGKFLGLLMKSNPTLMELIHAEKFIILDPIMEPIIEAVPSLISSEKLKFAYSGMIKDNLSNSRKEFGFNMIKGRKNLRHAIRLSRQGRLAIHEGVFQVRVSDPQEYFDLDKMPYEDVLAKAEKEYSLLESDERPFFFNNQLGVDFANILLKDIRSLA